jgi:hypothetical protein
MKLAVSVLPLIAAHVASASTFEEFGAGGVQPASQLYEAACDVDVKLEGSVATVVMKQRIVNGGTVAVAGIYGFQLPPDAAITSLALAQGKGGAAEKAIAVPTGFRSTPIDSADILGPDPALLQAVPDGYEIVLQPIAAGHEIQLVTTYTTIATPRAGTLQVTIPGRKAEKLAPCKGTIRATPGPSATVKAIRVGSTPAPNRSFSVEKSDVVIAVELDIAGTQPVVWIQSQTLPDGPLASAGVASLVTVLGPRVKAAFARRVVLLIDGSRSMELVGRQNVSKVIKALGGALPSGAEIEAILFDRTATRVFGDVRPANAQNLALIETAVAKRGAVNGSNLVGAFELAKQVIEGARGQAMVVVITDGVTGEIPDQALIKALGAKTSTVDVHAIVLDPAHTRSPGGKALRSPINLYGGAYVEVNVDDLDDALGAIDEWMRPSWLELTLGDQEIPTEVRGGAGFVRLLTNAPAKLVLRGHGDAKFEVAARPGPAAPVGSLVRPVVTTDRSLVVLATTGRIAKNRSAMIAGGGRYERSVAIKDAERSAGPAPTVATLPATPIARITLERMFRDQLHPKAFGCYQRALGKNPKLGGTVGFKLRLGRGEVTDVQLIGSGDAVFDACLVDAAYALTTPLPDFTVNADDQTIANYPLTFNRRDDQPVVVIGDADSVSPIDIDAVEGGVPVPARRKEKVKVETKTPLGGMRPPKSP